MLSKIIAISIFLTRNIPNIRKQIINHRDSLSEWIFKSSCSSYFIISFNSNSWIKLYFTIGSWLFLDSFQNCKQVIFHDFLSLANVCPDFCTVIFRVFDESSLILSSLMNIFPFHIQVVHVDVIDDLDGCLACPITVG